MTDYLLSIGDSANVTITGSWGIDVGSGPMGFAYGSGFHLPPDVPDISPEDQAVIDEVIIESIVRGYMRDHR